MNSYPPELLAQLSPIMFVAGLDTPNAEQTPGTAEGAPLDSPRNQDPYTSLIARLRDALAAHRKLAIWQPPALSKSFHVVLVDKVRFPPRKLATNDSPHSTTHSPLSPLHPSSPLYPDGLIAPIWIRKHTTLVPSVFVLFMRLFEYTATGSRTPLDGPDAERERQERQQDAQLSADIAQAKRQASERSIKLTVVLLASRKMLGTSTIAEDPQTMLKSALDDASLDSRLTFIRRQSGLDSRAALFVLSPVSPAELAEFIKRCELSIPSKSCD